MNELKAYSQPLTTNWTIEPIKSAIKQKAKKTTMSSNVAAVPCGQNARKIK